MDKRTTDIVAYITIFGWLAACAAGDKANSKFHLNQALVLHLASMGVGMLQIIPLIRLLVGLAQIVIFVFWVMGLLSAVRGQENEVPLLGGVKLLK